MEATEGKILIDGVDLSKVGLTDLRSRLSKFQLLLDERLLMEFTAIIPRVYLHPPQIGTPPLIVLYRGPDDP